MSYIYNPLLRDNLQKWETGSGSDPDYSKIKGSLISGYDSQNTLGTAYPLYIDDFSANGKIHYVSKSGFAKNIVQTKSLLFDKTTTGSIYSFPVLTGTSDGLAYMDYQSYYTMIGSYIGSFIDIKGSNITGWGTANPLTTGSVITGNLYVAISTGDKVEKVSYSNFFSSIDGDSLGTHTTGLSSYTPLYLFSTIQENSGHTIERLSISDVRSGMFRSDNPVAGSLMSGVTGVYVRFGSQIQFATKSDFKTWLNA